MRAVPLISATLAAALASAGAHGQSLDEVPGWRIADAPQPPSLVLQNRDDTGLPGLRPRLTMRLPLDQQWGERDRRDDSGAFSWSLEAWQLNTASLAHIQCNHHSLTIDSFVAEDCRFVDQPLPDNSVNLVQVRGEWMPAPGLQLSAGAFRAQNDGAINPALMTSPLMTGSIGQPALTPFGSSRAQALDGVDLNLSFGINSNRVGDFLVGLQVARYRQRMSMLELGLTSDPVAALDPMNHYANAAQLSLGWRRGSFGGDLLGHYRDAPLWLPSGPSQASFNSFDLEFSWRPRNAALSIGISNVLDSAPRLDEPDASLDDPMEQVFGRIPYVRYKHDL
jgi:hypothetical protein